MNELLEDNSKPAQVSSLHVADKSVIWPLVITVLTAST